MLIRFALLISGVLFLASCGLLGLRKKPSWKVAQVPEHLRAGRNEGVAEVKTTVTGGASTVESAVLAQGGVAAAKGFSKKGGTSGFAREQDIVWTNPDDPYAKLPELDELLSVRERKNDWGVSYTRALREASAEGKPVMLWFTNSLNSPRCQALSAEVLGVPEFEKWAAEHIKRVRLDGNIDDSNMGLTQKTGIYVEKKKYLEGLKKRYGVHGYPTIVLLGADGQVMAKYRGYKPGDADFYKGRLQLAVEQAQASHKKWRGTLEKKGYRQWRNEAGRTVFAKLLKYAKGHVFLVEPDGRRSRTTLEKLSHQDQLWLEVEKKRATERRRR